MTPEQKKLRDNPPPFTTDQVAYLRLVFPAAVTLSSTEDGHWVATRKGELAVIDHIEMRAKKLIK